jgi:DNA-binding transcriptional regulator YiaG
MSELARIGGGWFDERPVGTGASFIPKMVGCCVMVASMLANAGTGDVPNLSDVEKSQSNIQLVNSTSAPIVAITHKRTSSDDLTYIREVFSPAISDLAATLGVSRQAVYNWINGEQPRVEFAEKLSDLAQAAEILSHEGIVIDSLLLKRKFSNGRSILQVSQAGDSARNAALLLVQIVKRETEQRERMNARFAGRAKTQPTSDFDIPAANDLA